MNKLKVQVSLKDEKYPFFEDKALDITEIGDRARGRVIYFSGRFVESGENMNFNNISDIDLLIYEIEFIFCFLVFFFIIQAKRKLEKIEEEEILRILRRKYEKGDR